MDIEYFFIYSMLFSFCFWWLVVTIDWFLMWCWYFVDDRYERSHSTILSFIYTKLFKWEKVRDCRGEFIWKDSKMKKVEILNFTFPAIIAPVLTHIIILITRFVPYLVIFTFIFIVILFMARYMRRGNKLMLEHINNKDIHTQKGGQ